MRKFIWTNFGFAALLLTAMPTWAASATVIPFPGAVPATTIDSSADCTLLLPAPRQLPRQSLQAAMVQSPDLAKLVNAVKDAAGVDCITTDSFPWVSVRGPTGQSAVSHQSACFDPTVFNPTQWGQLIVTYYGEGKAPNSPVGAVIEVRFEVFK